MRLATHRDGHPRADSGEVAYAANHDLRAPIVAICQLVESIQEEFAAELPEEVARRLLLIRERADRFDGLLRRLNRFWRAADTSEPAAAVDLAQLVGDLARELAPPPGAIIQADAATIEVPRRALRQVLCELIDNAIRHARCDDLRIRVASERRADGWEVSVSDNGRGIPPCYQERVWRLFTTLQAGADTGLGLPIARRIVEAHGGRAWIDQAAAGGIRIGLFWPSPPASAR